MKIATQWRVSTVALAAAIILLAGCASPGATSAGQSALPAATKTPRPKPTPTPSPTPTQELLALEFGSAEDLVQPQWGIGWSDPFVTDDGFAVLAADDGNGSWAYTELTSACELHFYQGTVADLDWTQDDRVVSDQMLAILAMGTPTDEDRAQISANAGDFSVGLVPHGGEVQLRVIGGSYPDGRTVVQATRMFGALQGGITVSMLCPAGQDASSQFGRLAERALRVSLTT